MQRGGGDAQGFRMRIFLAGLGILLASGVLAIVAAVIGALGDGRTVAAGERAVSAIGGFDLGVAIAGCLAFGYVTRGLSPATRWLARIGFALLEVVWLAAWVLLTLVMFDR